MVSMEKQLQKKVSLHCLDNKRTILSKYNYEKNNLYNVIIVIKNNNNR